MNREYTLLEAAKALGMTKNTVKYRMKNVPAEMVRSGSNGRIYITDAAFPYLRETSSETTENQFKTGENQVKPVYSEEKTDFKPGNTQKTRTENHQQDPDPAPLHLLERTVEILQEQLRVKDQQLEAKDKQIEDLTAALRNAQTLHAAQIQTGLLTSGDEETPPEQQHKPFWQRLWKK